MCPRHCQAKSATEAPPRRKGEEEGGGELRASETAGREGGWRAGKKAERAKEKEEENEAEVRTSKSGLSVKVSDLYIYTQRHMCVSIYKGCQTIISFNRD